MKLAKFNVDSSGTVEEKRKRLVAFVGIGEASVKPKPQTLPPLTIQTSPTPPGTSDICNAHKLQVYFVGDTAAFIERAEEVCTSRRVVLDDILP